MKQFSIHKVNKPMMRPRNDEDPQGLTADDGPEVQEQTLLSAEEREALQPKEVKVVNPWIHEATHKEYLESVKVSHYYLLGGRGSLFKYYFLTTADPKYRRLN